MDTRTRPAPLQQRLGAARTARLSLRTVRGAAAFRSLPSTAVFSFAPADGVLGSVHERSGRTGSSGVGSVSESPPGSAARGAQSAQGPFLQGSVSDWPRPPTSSGRRPSMSPGRADEERWPSERLSCFQMALGARCPRRGRWRGHRCPPRSG